MQEVEQWVERTIRFVNLTAAVLLGAITLLTFVSVVFRYVFNAPVPDSFDIGRLLLGVSVFWGIAAATFRSEHIQVDILDTALSERGRRLLDMFSSLVFLVFMGALTWMFFAQTDKRMRSGQTTADLLVPVWPFHGVAWIGSLLTVLVLVFMLWRYSSARKRRS